MKKIIVSFLLVAHLFVISAPALAEGIQTGTNAYEDSQKASTAEEMLWKVEEENRKASELNDQQYRNSAAELGMGAGSAGITFGLGMGVKNLIKNGAKGTRSNKTDTQSTPLDWDLKKKNLKPWEILLISAFIARELREVFAESRNGNAQIDDSGFTSNWGEMKKTNDPRTKAVVTIFRAVAHLSQEIGKKIAKLAGAIIIVGGAIEVMLIILREMVDPNEENLHTMGSIMKGIMPQLVFLTIIAGLISTGFLWQIYIGPLFSLSMGIGGIIGGKTFTLYTLPDFITKLFNAPFEVIWAGIKMMFNVKMAINSFMPFLVIISGIFLMFLVFKAICEMMQVIVDYILVGLFGTIILGFMVLGITKKSGSGVIGAFLAAIMNVIVLFSIAGIIFKLIDTLEQGSNISAGKLLAVICSLYISVVMIGMVKDIGKSIHQGSNASVQGSAVIDTLVDAGFQIATFATIGQAVAAVGAQELAKGMSEEAIKGMTEKEIQGKATKDFKFGERFKAGIEAMKNGEGKGAFKGEQVGKFFQEYAKKAKAMHATRDQTKLMLKGEGGMLEKQSVFGNGKLGKIAPKGLTGTVEDVMRGQRQIEEARLKKAEAAKGKLGKTGKEAFTNRNSNDMEQYANAAAQAYAESANEMAGGQDFESYNGNPDDSSEEDEA